MRTKISLFLFAIALLSVACSKVEGSLQSNLLEGVWVNSATKTDTLDFNVKPSLTTSPNVFKLKRGTLDVQGNSISKVGSGYYEYVITGDKILLKGLVIDIHNGKEYVFSKNEDNKSLQIGSFAPFEGGKSLNEFVRID